MASSRLLGGLKGRSAPIPIHQPSSPWQIDQKPTHRKRYRRLTIPLDKGPIYQGTKRETNNQLQSLLFKLPYEIREIIWYEALGGHVINIDYINGKLFTRVGCRCEGSERLRQLPAADWICATGRHRSLGKDYILSPIRILLSCRRMCVLL